VVQEYAGLTELAEVEYFYNFGDNKAIEPVVIHTGLMGEDLEGALVTLENVIFEEAGETVSTQSRTYSFYDAQGQGVLYSEWSGRLPGKKLPPDRTSITGIVSQYQGSYQLLVRNISDLSVNTHNPLLSAPAFDVKVYPNPAKNRLFIESSCRFISIAVVSAGGSTRPVETNDMGYLDVSAWQTGLYLLRFETEKNGFVYKKILVQ